MTVTDDPRRRLMCQVFIACEAFGITRADRLEWATVVLNRNVDSFRDLDPVELCRLVDAANGAVYMARIKMERRDGVRL